MVAPQGSVEKGQALVKDAALQSVSKLQRRVREYKALQAQAKAAADDKLVTRSGAAMAAVKIETDPIKARKNGHVAIGELSRRDRAAKRVALAKAHRRASLRASLQAKARGMQDPLKSAVEEEAPSGHDAGAGIAGAALSPEPSPSSQHSKSLQAAAVKAKGKPAPIAEGNKSEAAAIEVEDKPVPAAEGIKPEAPVNKEDNSEEATEKSVAVNDMEKKPVIAAAEKEDAPHPKAAANANERHALPMRQVAEPHLNANERHALPMGETPAVPAKQPPPQLPTAVVSQRPVAAATVLAPPAVALPLRGKDWVAGVEPSRQASYRKSTWHCDNGAKELPRHQINDNYCDCIDGSDEPGTAACAATEIQFWCPGVTVPGRHEKLILGQHATSIPTAFVGDGVCDCCDGSDEAPSLACPNQCGKQEAAEKALALVRQAGREKRAQHVQEATQWLQSHQLSVLHDPADGGPDNAFLALHGKCYHHHQDGYDYEVCPFSKVNQCGGTGGCVTVGQGYQWRRPFKEMAIGGGASCPNGVSREARLQFECTDKEDRVLTVEEFETCKYSIGFATAAAC